MFRKCRGWPKFCRCHNFFDDVIKKLPKMKFDNFWTTYSRKMVDPRNKAVIKLILDNVKRITPFCWCHHFWDIKVTINHYMFWYHNDIILTCWHWNTEGKHWLYVYELILKLVIALVENNSALQTTSKRPKTQYTDIPKWWYRMTMGDWLFW